MKTNWRETAKEIGNNAYKLYGDQEDGLIGFVIEYVEDMAKETVEVAYLDEAYKTVYDANINDYKVFKEATQALLTDISLEKNIENIITRLAYWVIYIKAMHRYWELVEQEEMMINA